MMTIAQQNRRTGARMQAWLDARPKVRARLVILLRSAMMTGMRKMLAPDAQRDPFRASLAPALAPRAPIAARAPSSTRTPACMGFEGCEGNGWTWRWTVGDGIKDPSFVQVGAQVYCHCGAGERLRVADGVRTDAMERPASRYDAKDAPPRPSSVIADNAPNDGRHWDCHCARCGSSVEWNECEACAGMDEDFYCAQCDGENCWLVCLSPSDWCEANPLPDRADVKRGKLEWFVIA